MGHRKTVRKHKLRCSRCKEWKLDEEFGPSTFHKSRRFRRYECRFCEAARAREKRIGA